MTRENLNEMSESKSAKDKRVIELLKDPEKLLATILIVNDFVNVGVVMLLSRLEGRPRLQEPEDPNIIDAL